MVLRSNKRKQETLNIKMEAYGFYVEDGEENYKDYHGWKMKFTYKGKSIIKEYGSDWSGQTAQELMKSQMTTTLPGLMEWAGWDLENILYEIKNKKEEE